MVLKQQASTIQSRPVKNIGKVGKKEQNEANCTNVHVTARLQLINCFKRRTSHELLKLINYSYGYKPIGVPHFGQVHVS